MNFKSIFLLGSAFAFIVTYQNCSNVDFTAEAQPGLAKASSSEAIESDVKTEDRPADDRRATDERSGEGTFKVGDALCQKLNRVTVGQKITLSGVTITVGDVIHKDKSDGEIVGFELTTDGSGLSYLIKAGGEGHYSTDLNWVHPNGTTGPDAPALSHITFCIGDTPSGIPDPSLGEKNNPSLPSSEPAGV